MIDVTVAILQILGFFHCYHRPNTNTLIKLLSVIYSTIIVLFALLGTILFTTGRILPPRRTVAPFLTFLIDIIIMGNISLVWLTSFIQCFRKANIYSIIKMIKSKHAPNYKLSYKVVMVIVVIFYITLLFTATNDMVLTIRADYMFIDETLYFDHSYFNGFNKEYGIFVIFLKNFVVYGLGIYGFWIILMLLALLNFRICSEFSIHRKEFESLIKSTTDDTKELTEKFTRLTRNFELTRQKTLELGNAFGHTIGIVITFTITFCCLMGYFGTLICQTQVLVKFFVYVLLVLLILCGSAAHINTVVRKNIFSISVMDF